MMQWTFQPRTRLRSPLARFAAAVIGIVVIAAVGLFALGALAVVAIILLIGFGLRRLTGGATPAAARTPPSMSSTSESQVIDGDFVVIEPNSQTRRP